MKKLFFILVVIFLFMTNLFAQNQILKVGKANAMANELVLTSQNDNQITIRFDLNELELVEVETDYGKTFIAISNKAPLMLQKGFPELFHLTASFIVPDKGNSGLEISCGKYVDFENIEIAPSKGSLSRSIDPKTVPFVKGNVYQQNEFYPGRIASLREPFIMRDVRGQSVDIYPVQYNPVTKVLRVYSEITVTMNNNTRETGINEFSGHKRHQTIDPQFNEMYSNLFINYSVAQGRSYPTEEEGELLIICHPAFMVDMKPYVNWKRAIGRKTTMVSTATTGTTVTEIKTYISNYYNNAANNLAYVFLVGDSPQIPSYTYTNSSSSYSIVSDNYYGQLVGNDKYMEVLIGRISAETVTDVQTQVQRSIWYEGNMTAPDTYLYAAIGIATNEGGGGGHDGGEIDYVHMDNIRTRLLNYGYNPVYQEYGDNSGVTATNPTQISSRFNSGVGLANYCNHGIETAWTLSSGASYIIYNTTHVNALQNTGRLPFIFSVACLNGRFIYSQPCFAEAWLRATQNNQPTGAVATLMATISIGWAPPMTAQDEFVNICMDLPSPYSGIQPGIKRTFAGAAINATQKMLMVHGTSTRNTNDFDSWTVFGDPTLMIRTKTPQAMIVSHSSTIPFGANSFSVSCNVDGAFVAMSYTDGNNEVHIIGTATVSGGVASLTFTPITSTYPIKVTVTGKDRVTYQATVLVQCTTTNFTNQIVTTNKTVTGCNINVENINVTNNAKLKLNAPGTISIAGPFNVREGSSLEVR
jgi:hypothetical protein